MKKIKYARVKPRINITKVIIMVVAVLAVLGIIFGIVTKRPTSGSFNRYDLVDIGISAKDKYTAFNGGVVTINNNGELYFIDNKAKKMWGYSGASADMQLETSQNVVLAWAADKIQAFDKDGGLLYKQQYDLQINKLRTSDIITVAQMRSGQRANTLYILDKQGKVIDKLTELDKDGVSIVDFGLFGTGESVWVLSVDVLGYTPIYTFTTFKYLPEKHMTTIYTTKDQFIYRPVFSGTDIYLCGTSSVIALDSTGKAKYEVQSAGYQMMAYCPTTSSINVLLNKVNVDGSTPKNNTNLLLIKDGIWQKITALESIIGSVVKEDKLMLFSENSMYLYYYDNLPPIKYALPIKADKIITQNNELLIEAADKVYLLNIPS